MDNKKEETETITIISSDEEDPESEHLERKKAKAMAKKSLRKRPQKGAKPSEILNDLISQITKTKKEDP